MTLLNKKAPNFKLLDQNDELQTLDSFQEDYLILFFYPKDDTPGCTIESVNFTKELSTFKKLNARPIGISGGNASSKNKFCNKHKLKTSMLADETFEVSQKYAVYGEKSFMGKKYLGISRNTFVLDSKRKIIKIYDQVKPATHVEEVIDFIKSQLE